MTNIVDEVIKAITTTPTNTNTPVDGQGAALVTEVVKHLAGKHDQRSHGRKGAKSTSFAADTYAAARRAGNDAESMLNELEYATEPKYGGLYNAESDKKRRDYSDKFQRVKNATFDVKLRLAKGYYGQGKDFNAKLFNQHLNSALAAVKTGKLDESKVIDKVPDVPVKGKNVVQPNFPTTVDAYAAQMKKELEPTGAKVTVHKGYIGSPEELTRGRMPSYEDMKMTTIAVEYPDKNITLLFRAREDDQGAVPVGYGKLASGSGLEVGGTTAYRDGPGQPWYSFDAVGVSESFYHHSFTPDYATDAPKSFKELAEGQVARVEAARNAHKTSLPVPGLGWSVQPSMKKDYSDKLKAGQTVTFSTRGFGTWKDLSTKPMRGFGDTKGSKELADFFGVKDIWIHSYDMD